MGLVVCVKLIRITGTDMVHLMQIGFTEIYGRLVGHLFRGKSDLMGLHFACRLVGV